MKSLSSSADERFATIVRLLKVNPKVTLGLSKKQGFGSSALCINDKIFAMVSSKGQFVVKLPRDRVDALVASGMGERFDPGHGRVMKEWLAVPAKSPEDWLALAREAMRFVGSKR